MSERKMLGLGILLALFALSGCAPEDPGYTWIHGTLYRETAFPLANVEAAFHGSGFDRKVMTDRFGRFRYRFHTYGAPLQGRFVVTASGYLDSVGVVNEGNARSLVIRMIPAPKDLAAELDKAKRSSRILAGGIEGSPSEADSYARRSWKEYVDALERTLERSERERSEPVKTR